VATRRRAFDSIAETIETGAMQSELPKDTDDKILDRLTR